MSLTDFKLSINDNEIGSDSLDNDKLTFTGLSIEYNAGTITLELKAMIEIKDENAFIETHLDVDGNNGTKYNDLGNILPGKTQVDGATLSVR